MRACQRLSIGVHNRSHLARPMGRFCATGRSQEGQERPLTATEKAHDMDHVEGSRPTLLFP